MESAVGAMMRSGRRVMSNTAVPLCTVSVISSPLFPLSALDASLAVMEATLSPLMLLIMSWALSPARSAGEDGKTEAMMTIQESGSSRSAKDGLIFDRYIPIPV